MAANDPARPKRVTCPTCGWRVRAKQDGSAEQHMIWFGDRSAICNGSRPAALPEGITALLERLRDLPVFDLSYDPMTLEDADRFEILRACDVRAWADELAAALRPDKED